MEFKELEQKVIEWAENKGIFKSGNPVAQSHKTLEECDELVAAVAENNTYETRDAIGDIIVTLIIQSRMQGVTLEECLEQAYNEIKDRKGKMVGGTFVKNI